MAPGILEQWQIEGGYEKEISLNVCCVQKTKWKEEKIRKIGEGFKILHSGKTCTRNGVGVIVVKNMREKVEVFRKSNRIIVVIVIVENMITIECN